MLVLAVLLLSAGCGEMPQRKALRGGTGFFPLLEDRALRYRQSGEEGTLDYTLTLHYIGGRQWKVFVVKGEDIPYGGIEFQSDGRYVEAVTSRSMTSLDSRSKLGEFSQVWLDDSAAVDSSWQDLSTGTETLVAGFETVTVPAGTYEDCLVTATTPLPQLADSVEARFRRDEMNEETYLLEREYARWQTVRWFAFGVGLVKEQLGPPGQPRITRELVAIENEGFGSADSSNTEINHLQNQ